MRQPFSMPFSVSKIPQGAISLGDFFAVHRPTLSPKSARPKR